MVKMRLIPVAVVCCLAACSSGDDPLPTTTSTIATTTPVVTSLPPNLTEAYFESLASGPASEQAAVSSAMPGSDASIYAEHQAVARDLLGLVSPRPVVARGRGFEICDSNDACNTFDAVVADPATGQVTSFSIDSVALKGRIVGGGLVADRDGVVARVRSAYRSTDGDVSLLVEIDNTTEVTVEMFGFASVLEAGVGGDSVETTGAWGSGMVEPGMIVDLLLSFPSTGLAGELRLSGLRSDGLDISLAVRVPAPG